MSDDMTSVRVLDLCEVRPENCPICVDVAKLDRRLRGDECEVHGRMGWTMYESPEPKR